MSFPTKPFAPARAAALALALAAGLLAGCGPERAAPATAAAGVGMVCLSDFMTAADRASGALVQVLAKDTVDVRQPVNAVYYRNTQLSARITSFLDFLAERLAD